MAVKEKALGPGDPGLAPVLDSYARMLLNAGRSAGAAIQAKRANAIRAKKGA